YLEALRAGVMSRFLADFHELRQDFSPTEPEASTTFECSPQTLIDQPHDDRQASLGIIGIWKKRLEGCRLAFKLLEMNLRDGPYILFPIRSTLL
ncbi:MAG: hypothetical protein M3R47_12925, partial [Chloroflexota bacterium]|nr:hypothetical protein [Chloroflexota bacterium]